MNTTIELTKGEMGMVIGALHLWRMEFAFENLNKQTDERQRYLEKLDKLLEKLIDSVEKEKNQITLFQIIDNEKKR